MSTQIVAISERPTAVWAHTFFNNCYFYFWLQRTKPLSSELSLQKRPSLFHRRCLHLFQVSEWSLVAKRAFDAGTSVSRWLLERFTLVYTNERRTLARAFHAGWSSGKRWLLEVLSARPLFCVCVLFVWFYSLLLKNQTSYIIIYVHI